MKPLTYTYDEYNEPAYDEYRELVSTVRKLYKINRWAADVREVASVYPKIPLVGLRVSFHKGSVDETINL